MQQKYTLIDAFTKIPFAGAQIAVFTYADNLNEQQKQLLAKELNLTETVFITRSLDERYDAQLEIFTPQGNSDFAGHAVVAAGYALGDAGIVKSSDARILVNGKEIDITLGVKNKKVQINIPVSEKYDEYVPSNVELSELIGIDESEIGYNAYKPMLAGCPEYYLILPVKNNQALRKAKFNANKWQLSFVASLAKQILLFTGDHPFKDANFAARIIGKYIPEKEDPPIGAAAPSFGLYLSYGKNDYHRSSLVQRGDESSRISILEVNIDKKGPKVMGLQLGGHATKVGEGYFNLPD